MFDQWDLIAIGWFFLIWIGYTIFADWQSSKRMCLAGVMFEFRKDWMARLLKREQRVGDISAIGNLERNAAFFSSSCLLIIAGLLTVLSSATQTINLMLSLSFIDVKSQEVWEIKILLMITVYIYAFFTFTWCMRQYGVVSVIMGGAPLPNEEDISDQEREDFVQNGARVLNLAGKQFNLGLRAYYFSLALLGWFIGPFWFMGVTTLVVMILFRREFLSATMVALVKTNSRYNAPAFNTFGIVRRKQKRMNL